MAAVAKAAEVKKEVMSPWCIPSYHLVHKCLFLPGGFHSFHVCFHRKAAQITKVRFKKQQLTP